MFLNEQEINQEKAKTYINQTILGINENEEEILKLISQNLKEKWDISRISKVNTALLKLATYEIVYAKLPYKVVVNEVVEIAKKYGVDSIKASLFSVNGSKLSSEVPPVVQEMINKRNAERTSGGSGYNTPYKITIEFAFNMYQVKCECENWIGVNLELAEILVDYLKELEE